MSASGTLLGRLRPVDWVLLTYLAIESAVALTRLELLPHVRWILLANGLAVLLVFLATRPGLGPVGRVLAELYPIIVMVASYGALDVLTGHGGVATHERTVQGWELALFGQQVSREWWQRSPSQFWSTLLHGVYLSYYLIVPTGPLWFLARGRRRDLRRVVLALLVTYAICYIFFLLFPVAGPNYEFPRPSGMFVENPTARLAYRLLARGSSYGAAFPSSHVAAALVASAAAGLGSISLGVLLGIPSVLLIVAVVYCQMHYAVDSLAGVLLAAVVIAGMVMLERRRESADRQISDQGRAVPHR